MAISRVSRRVFLAVLTCAALSTPAPVATSAQLNRVHAGIDRVSEDALQFWVELGQSVEIPVAPDQSVTCVWFVDTDGIAATGQSHNGVGSEYNVRAVLRNHASHGGGFIDGIDGRSGGSVPMHVKEGRVTVRVTLGQIGNTARFRWSYGVSGPGYSWDATDPGTFHLASTPILRNKPARVVIQSCLNLRDGRLAASPDIWLFDRSNAQAAKRRHDVSLFAYRRNLVAITQQEVSAIANAAGTLQVTALVDGVLSSNAARVMVGNVEIAPAVVHMEPGTRPAATVAIKVTDARGVPQPLEGRSVSFFSSDETVAKISERGTITAFPSGAGKLAWVWGEFDGTRTTNSCVVRVPRYPAPLAGECECRGRYVSFWYPPVSTRPIPQTCRFQELIDEYGLIVTLDQVYLQLEQLTGVLPFSGGRQCLAAVCEDDVFKLCGVSGNPVALGFDPSVPTSCVQLADGRPHWGVICHEIGHNFVGCFDALNAILCDSRLSSGSAYAEGLATLCNLRARHAIAANPRGTAIPSAVYDSFLDPQVYDSLPFQRRAFVEEALPRYLKQGARYPQDFTADVLDAILLVLAEEHGWDIYRRFFSVFFPPDEPIAFAPQSESERATFFIAAMSAAARKDLRSRFKTWGFPCDNDLLLKLAPYVSERAATRDAQPVRR